MREQKAQPDLALPMSQVLKERAMEVDFGKALGRTEPEAEAGKRTWISALAGMNETGVDLGYILILPVTQSAAKNKHIYSITGPLLKENKVLGCVFLSEFATFFGWCLRQIERNFGILGARFLKKDELPN